VFVNGNYAPSRADNSFEGKVSVTPGENPVTVEAIDENGNTTTNQYSVTVTGSGSKTLVYDANGNLTSDGTRTFEWDPLNRLTAVTSGTHRSEFSYNGQSQRVKIVEKDDGSVTSTKQFVWCSGDAQPSEERDGSNAVTKRFYAQGEQIGNASYYYTKDHLGSIRELTDNSGAVQTRYDYDPYGRRTKLTGNVDADFGFTGHYYHQPSGLHLAQYRAYDADLGRWISRDPIRERGGLNLYGYMLNDPLTNIDPLGLAPNTAGVTSMYHIVNQLFNGASLYQLSASHITNTNRYFYSDTYGWIDVRHFAAAADYVQQGYPGWWVKTLGFGLELEEWLTEWGDAYRSGLSPEDLPSNSAGVDFGRCIKPGESLADAFKRWARENGVRSPTDPATGFWDLPLTDPSVRR